MRKRLIWIVLLLIALGIAGLLLKPKKIVAPAATPVAAVLEFLPQEIISVTPMELRQTLALSGSLRAVEQVSVKARLAAEVREVLVREGEAVKAGQVLVRMDTSEYQAKVDQARGNLNAAHAQLDIATKTRDNNLALLDKGFISRNAFDNAASQFAVAQANVEASRGALDVAQKSLNDTVIRAPLSGLVSMRSVQPGEKVSADNRLLDIINLQNMELEAAVPTSDIEQVTLGQGVTLRVEGLSDSFHGRVTRINPSTQTGSRSVMVYIQVPNPQALLRAGMFAEGQLILRSKPGVLALPPGAVHQDSNAVYVYAIEDGKLIKKTVRIGIEGRVGDDSKIEILDGLSAGAQVISNNMGTLRAGSAVRITPANSKP
jgi:RND family efflux transporter MFP subunit